MTSRPRPDPALTPPNALNVQNVLELVSPHETTPPPRPRSIPGRGRGRRADPASTPPHTTKFTASTCPKCHHITIAGITNFGFTLHLETLQLTDLDEAQAIADLVPTYNLYPDRLVRLRWLTHIRHPTTAPRHARHVCGTTYGTRTPPAPARTRAALSDTPPF